MKIFLSIAMCCIAILSYAQNLEWANTLGGEGTDRPLKIKLDSEGNIYAAGSFINTANFSDSEIELEGHPQALNGYIYKRSVNGSLLWAKALGGFGDVKIYDIAIDSDDNLIVAGQYYTSIIFGTGGNSFSISSTGLRDGFIAKYASDGTFLDAQTLGSSNNDDITTISIDNDQNIILFGRCGEEGDFDFGSDEHTVFISNSDERNFILKVSPEFDFISVFRVSCDALNINKLTTTANNNYILAGNYYGTINFNDTTWLSHQNNEPAGLVMKITADGNFIWATRIAGETYQDVVDFKLAEDGYTYITGQIQGLSTFLSPVGSQPFQSDSNSRDVFFAKMNQAGNFDYIKIIAGPGTDQVGGIEIDQNGNIILVGSYDDTMDFDPSLNEVVLTPQGGSSSFIAVYTPDGDYSNVITFQNENHNNATGLALSETDEIYLSGWFSGSIDFSLMEPGYAFESNGVTDTYLLKLDVVPVSIDHLTDTNRTTLYPNPAQSEIQFNTDGVILFEVYNALGKKILTKDTAFLHSNQTISVATLPNGTYLIRITADDGTQWSEKLIISK